jgi:purine-cytosine permease-like protein
MLLGGWALCPWIIIQDGTAFLSFMGAYSIFMAPIAGIPFCDYWLIKRRKYDVSALYDPHGIYYYRVSFSFNAPQYAPKCQWDLLVEINKVWDKVACSSMYLGGHYPPSTRSRPCRDA